jgi:hypothetical protein
MWQVLALRWSKIRQRVRDIHSLCGYPLHKHVDNSASTLRDMDLRCAGQYVATDSRHVR